MSCQLISPSELASAAVLPNIKKPSTPKKDRTIIKNFLYSAKAASVAVIRILQATTVIPAAIIEIPEELPFKKAQTPKAIVPTPMMVSQSSLLAVSIMMFWPGYAVGGNGGFLENTQPADIKRMSKNIFSVVVGFRICIILRLSTVL